MGEAPANLQQRAFDFLLGRPSAKLCDACAALPYACESVRNALSVLCRKGAVQARRAGHALLYSIVDGAQRPVDGRGKWRKR